MQLFVSCSLCSLPSSDASQSIRAITYGDKLDSEHDISSLYGKLIPVLERLELLSQVLPSIRVIFF